MWFKWFPWQYIVRRLARRHGFLDPISVYTYLRRFAQPSEVMEPIELLRAGVAFHARGLMNSRAIQHNLDWVWPYWVERQFDPHDASFIPRAFSLTHINLTHRNWTAVGLPNTPIYPLVDPRGLVTPFFDGWSLDFWMVTEDGKRLFPSQSGESEQQLVMNGGLSVATTTTLDTMRVHTEVSMHVIGGQPACHMRVEGTCDKAAWLVVSLRPYNPEGVSFVHKISVSEDRRHWGVEGKPMVEFSEQIDRHHLSEYHNGDVAQHLLKSEDRPKTVCDVGMATAAAMFRVEPGKARQLEVVASLDEDQRKNEVPASYPPGRWERSLEGVCRMRLPEAHYQFLYDAAIHTLILHAPDEVYPGPFTYKRFWFRDAAFILNAMLCTGMNELSERILRHFPANQTAFGYFHSQEGEWDSNGESLWIMERFCAMTGRKPPEHWHHSIKSGANWILKKRIDEDEEGLHAGLMPAGFSAEHLGPNDYYYWDDFWSVAGLEAAARMLEAMGEEQQALHLREEARAFIGTIEKTLEKTRERLGRPAIPASPYRRLDSGAIGSIIPGYPLYMWDRVDERVLDTIEYLMSDCRVYGGFFQDMIHSGVNAYLTLHMAQVLLRAGDERAFELIQVVAEFASPTGQWPEASHPATRGGCMGDGQHVWAAAEWVMMMRNLFMYEEPEERKLVLGAGLQEKWLTGGEPLEFGPGQTLWGTISLRVEPGAERVVVSWEAQWHDEPPAIEVRLPGMTPVEADPQKGRLELQREFAS